eukprot:12723673-Alexandrium_andersonii.AAC.1
MAPRGTNRHRQLQRSQGAQRPKATAGSNGERAARSQERGVRGCNNDDGRCTHKWPDRGEAGPIAA